MATTATRKTTTKKKKETSEIKNNLLSLKKEVETFDIDKYEEILGEHEYYKEYIVMFKKLRRIARKLETHILEQSNHRAIYALMSVYSQQREVIADIRSVTDFTQHANMLTVDVLQPAYNSLTQSCLDIFYHIRKLIIEVSDERETQYALQRLEDLMREQGKLLQDSYINSSQKMVSYFRKK